MVKKSDSTPIQGVKVNAGGPGAWGEAYTDASGLFEISGLKASSGDYESYYLSVEKDGYVRTELGNQRIPTDTKVLDLSLTPFQLDQGISLSGNIIMPNAPVAGTVRDQWGNLMYDLWGRVEVWRTDGPGWYGKDVRIPLPQAIGQVTQGYAVYLEPGNFEMQVIVPGYVSKTLKVTVPAGSAGVTGQDVTLSKSAVLIGRVKLPFDASQK